jgi:hypothetical protein
MMDFLRAIKIHSTTTFGEKVKPSTPYNKILWHVKNPEVYERDTTLAKFMAISHQLPPCFTTSCLCWFLPESSGG